MATAHYTRADGADESTYILENAPPSSTSNVQFTVNGTALSTQLGEFTVPDADQEELKLRDGAFPATTEEDFKKEKSSIAFTSFNYINSIVGSGVIGMPYALYQAGYGLGIVLLLLIALLTDVSLVMMIRASKIADVKTYQDLAKAAFGKPGFIIQSFLQFMYPFISLISYNIIVGDTLTKVIIRLTGISSESVLVRREFIMITATLLITLPLSLYRNIARLAKVSLISVVMILIIAIAMAFRLDTMKEIVEPTEDAWTIAKPNIASAIGIMSFAFMCHHSSFMVYESLQDNTLERWNKTTHISIGASAILSLVYAVGGYFAFTGFVQGDIFENYCWGDDVMNFCRGFYALTILLTYPIECFVSRDVIENTFFSAYQPQPFFRHAAITAIIAILVFLLSLTTDCLGIVLELNGIFCAIPLAYILPTLCFIRLEEGGTFCKAKWKAWAVMIFGSVAMLTGVVTMITNYDSLNQCSHGQQMSYCFGENNTELHIPY